MADLVITECVVENRNGAGYLRPTRSQKVTIQGSSTTASLPLLASTQVIRLSAPSTCHWKLGAGATTASSMVPAGRTIDYATPSPGTTTYISVIDASGSGFV